MARKGNFYPADHQHSVASDELLVPKTDNEWIEERPPCVLLLPFSLQEPFPDVRKWRAGCKVGFVIEGLIEEHGQDRRYRGHEARDNEGEHDL
jgi:hypothetical protein